MIFDLNFFTEKMVQTHVSFLRSAKILDMINFIVIDDIRKVINIIYFVFKSVKWILYGIFNTDNIS